MKFERKVVWITGASSGIGEALALAFAREGALLVLSSRGVEALNKVKSQCDKLSQPSVCATVMPLDITDESALNEAVSSVLAQLGQIDILINNAGISQRSSCVNTSMSTYRQIFEVDVFGQIALTKAVLPSMIERGSGHLVVTSSVSGKIGVPFRTGYSAAKHAVMGFFDALRTEVHQHGILVSTVLPGYIKTNISANAVAGDGTRFGAVDSDIRSGMDAHACADVIIAGLAKGKFEIAVGTGAEMHALWIKRWFPNFLLKIMNKQYAKSAQKDGFE